MINAKHEKKRDILTEKLESGMAFEKRDFLSENGNVDIYATMPQFTRQKQQ